MSDYATFLQRKSQLGGRHGFAPLWMPSWLFDFQQSLVEWSLWKGRAALFCDCGMGKTPMQLVWAQNVVQHTNRPVLVVAPLAASAQIVREAAKFGISCERSVNGKHSGAAQVVVTNYERLHLFDSTQFVGAVCDESSILKNFDGATKATVTEFLGRTGVLVDVSGSMDAALSSKSEMKRMDVAAGLAVLVSGIAERARIFTFSEHLVEVPAYAGLALVDTVKRSQPNQSTMLGASVARLNSEPLDRLIVITDEQSHDRVPNPSMRGYMINVAANQRGVGYGPWVHVDGWSERVLDFIHEYERDDVSAS